VVLLAARPWNWNWNSTPNGYKYLSDNGRSILVQLAAHNCLAQFCILIPETSTFLTPNMLNGRIFETESQNTARHGQRRKARHQKLGRR
jgi:hypothetical protein